MDGIEFDLTKMTVREIEPILPKMFGQSMGWLTELAPLLVTRCPWGKADDPATYDFPVFGEEMGLLWKAFQQAIHDKPEAITFASFDLSRIKAKDFDALVGQISGADVHLIAEMLAKYVTACPEVKDVRDPEGYLDLVYYTQFRPLANKLSAAGKEQLENFLKRFAVKSSTESPPNTHQSASSGGTPA